MERRPSQSGSESRTYEHPDPPVEELKAAWSKTWNEITQEREWSDDHCAEINGKDTSDSAPERQSAEHRIMRRRSARAEMDCDKGYDHLTKEQRVYLKKKLAPEGSFFMKGKYPKTERTPPVVIDVRGTTPKASAISV